MWVFEVEMDGIRDVDREISIEESPTPEETLDFHIEPRSFEDWSGGWEINEVRIEWWGKEKWHTW
jgi:hypothetical protein